ncbi:hypothetical protein ABZ477_06935 [Microbacterium sp. NPDC019599]|uniref:hypothetical protein n=1 Tax=Microbacterium sp. NPDC019599 TaxID=3154690 RepID=UPI0033F096FB
MRIARSGSFVFFAQWVAAALLPAVFFFAAPWLEAKSEPFVRTPFAFLTIPILIIPPLLTLLDAEGRRERATRVAYDVASFVLWFAILFGGLTLPNPDPNQARDSALMNSWGIAYGRIPPIFVFAVCVIAAAYLAQVVTAIMSIMAGRRRAGVPHRSRT